MSTRYCPLCECDNCLEQRKRETVAPVPTWRESDAIAEAIRHFCERYWPPGVQIVGGSISVDEFSEIIDATVAHAHEKVAALLGWVPAQIHRDQLARRGKPAHLFLLRDDVLSVLYNIPESKEAISD